MNWSTRLVRVASGVVLAGLLACEESPTATDPAGTVSYGRYNNSGAGILLPHPFGCAVIDGTGALVGPIDCDMSTSTPSDNRNATVVVHASGVNNPTGTTVHWGPNDPGWNMAAFLNAVLGIAAPPYPCAVVLRDGTLGLTLDWQGTVTPSGQATVICHYRD